MPRKSTKPLSPYSQFIRTVQSSEVPHMSLTAIKKLPEVKHRWKCIQLQKKANECKDRIIDGPIIPSESNFYKATPSQKAEPFDRFTRIQSFIKR
jgi:hypothetical protein